jgi:hypothetical protein
MIKLKDSDLNKFYKDLDQLYNSNEKNLYLNDKIINFFIEGLGWVLSLVWILSLYLGFF